MSSIHNYEAVKNQVGGQQNVSGSIYNTSVTYATNYTLSGIHDVDGGQTSSLYSDILESLAFPEMLQRRNDIESPYSGTCKWLLDLKEYRDWLSQPRGLLWIKGKPGAGKSTLMSFLYDELRRDTQKTSEVFLDFFFSARGAELQRTPLGMLRALMNQLFRQATSVRYLVEGSYLDKFEAFGYKRGIDRTWNWQRHELEKLFKRAVLTCSQYQQVHIFIDALDEAGEAFAKEVAQLMHALNDADTGLTDNKKINALKICISCRHYPISSVIRSTEVWVERHNVGDIANYVHHRLNLKERFAKSATGMEPWYEMEADITHKAQGIFQWACLAVDILEKSIDDGESLQDVRALLRRVPRELKNIYEFVLRDVISPRHRAQSLLLFQWTCFAERPFSLEEMRHALAIQDTDTKDIGLQSAYAYSKSVMIKTDQQMQSRVKALSGGLIEVIEAAATEPRRHAIATEHLQVIHQSVTDFFAEAGLDLFDALRNTDPSMLTSDKSSTHRHDNLCKWHSKIYWSCLRHLALHLPMLHGNGRLSLIAKDVAYKVTNETDNHGEDNDAQCRVNLPFLQYAILNIFKHAVKARSRRSRDVASEIRLWEMILVSWPMLYNRAQSKKMEDCVVHPGATLLHLAVSMNAEDLFQESLKQDKVDVNARTLLGYSALHFAAQSRQPSFAQALLKAGADIDACTLLGDTPLMLATANNGLDLVKFFLHKAANVNMVTFCNQSALQVAAKRGSKEIFKALMGAGADAEVLNGEVGSVIGAAIPSLPKNKFMFSSLIKAVPRPSLTGSGWIRALNDACFHGAVDSVKLLLQAGVDPNTQSESVSKTSYRTDMDMLLRDQAPKYASQLIAEAESWDDRDLGRDQQIMLSRMQYDAMSSRLGEVIEMLNETQVHIEDRTGSQPTPLLTAALEGYVDIVERLIQHGADVNIPCGRYGIVLCEVIHKMTHANSLALHPKVMKNYFQIVHVLLKAGSSTDLQYLKDLDPAKVKVIFSRAAPDLLQGELEWTMLTLFGSTTEKSVDTDMVGRQFAVERRETVH